ncbi:MAG: ribose 5-phosphate isomerase B [Candidatus Gastranaerophilales bacterium]|nr:ribose 5-phosphate isomerase B [Candidatus Gastranaerophilales bacterium]
MKVIIGSDHGGYNLKSALKLFLEDLGYNVDDIGTYSPESCDYPPIAVKLAKKVLQSDDKGILICGTGIGMSIAANKIKGIRAALCNDTFSARMTREHNNSNVLCLGERVTGHGLAFDIAKIWLETPFSQEDKHLNRINLITDIENERLE